MERQENDSNDISNSFNNFGLSQQTLKGLKLKNYSKPSSVQKQSFGFSLQGNDLLVSAKTGSGKTLAFVIPILEKLHELKWSQNEGMGALIITPTRELAYQIFDVIKNIGKFHPFTISLITGGKDVVNEQKVINIANIVIATPGRLLQHFDETYGFSANNLQVLVLDEADRILDLGFRDEVDAIFENFSNNHELQILIFSATLT
ncbi:MAG: ATP-dependent RNA helicase, partial [Paramarteilia canceri]